MSTFSCRLDIPWILWLSRTSAGRCYRCCEYRSEEQDPCRYCSTQDRRNPLPKRTWMPFCLVVAVALQLCLTVFAFTFQLTENSCQPEPENSLKLKRDETSKHYSSLHSCCILFMILSYIVSICSVRTMCQMELNSNMSVKFTSSIT